MLRIRRPTKKREGVEEISSRGPFLTEAEAFDAGWRRIVVKLDPLAIRLRFHRGRGREWLVQYSDLLAFARAKEEQQRRKAKRGGK